MSPPSFQCPYCSAPLRIRNRNLIGKQLGCPDCGKPIRIASAGPKGLSLQKVQSKPRSRTAGKKTVRKREKPDRLSHWLSVLKSPVGISWSVAGLLAVMLLLAAWPFGKSASQDQVQLQDEKQALSTENSAGKKLSDHNGEHHAVGRSEGVDAVVDRENVFPHPVAAEKPVPLIEPDREHKPRSVPDRDPVVATIPPEPIDVQAALGQPILRFQQHKPAPLRELLTLVEEMAGVPIRYNASEFGDGSILLDEPVSLQLEQTTVGEILKTLLKQVHLEYELGFNEIRIVSPKPESTEENP